jgi:hypothetical protein
MMISDATSRALNAVNDLVDLLRLAHGAAERVGKDVHGSVMFDQADQMSRNIREMRRAAEGLRAEVDRFLKEQAAASIEKS